MSPGMQNEGSSSYLARRGETAEAQLKEAREVLSLDQILDVRLTKAWNERKNGAGLPRTEIEPT